MEDPFELEELIEQGLQIDFRDYSAVKNWLEKTYITLAASPEDQHQLELACFCGSTTPEEKIEQGLEILNGAADRLKYPEPEPLCNINCE